MYIVSQRVIDKIRRPIKYILCGLSLSHIPTIFHFVLYRKRPLIMLGKNERCHQSFQYNFIANRGAGVSLS